MYWAKVSTGRGRMWRSRAGERDRRRRSRVEVEADRARRAWLDAGPVGVGVKASRSGGEGVPLGARWSKEIR
jgi:hypothetical protein